MFNHLFNDVTELASLLVLVGLVMFLIIFYLKRQTSRLKMAIADLYQLNYELKYDVLCFIEHSWDILRNRGFQVYLARLFGMVKLKI